MILRKASKIAPLNKNNDCVIVVAFGEKKPNEDSADKKSDENGKEGEGKATKLSDKVSVDNCKLMV